MFSLVICRAPAAVSTHGVDTSGSILAGVTNFALIHILNGEQQITNFISRLSKIVRVNLVWRRLLYRLSKRQSLSTAVLFGTKFTWTIILSLLMKWLLGSNLSQIKNCLIKDTHLWVNLSSLNGHSWLKSPVWSVSYLDRSSFQWIYCHMYTCSSHECSYTLLHFCKDY